MAARMRILGVDPGSHATGWGVVQVTPALRLVASGVIRPGHELNLPDRLVLIHAELTAVIAAHAPQVMAVEDLFNARNARSSLILGHARGAILLAGAQAGLAVSEYPPGTVKQALTGNGQAGKEQVRFMVMRLLQLVDAPPLDESDALAVALAHQGRQRFAAALRAGGGR
ncbi:MAG TPA: crossover junction endodeoxyribonuclease RuvC [Candidatus Krumholzibacteria bacterium]|nr:crossover junction endodeoxyribonuclease RuvC [Candidatus Krumholzibacteria bacterium]HPD71370.1 crossover junction endodeoxyribonuclease RuvC [Candidatus Krumholzibacteria bacterium]HRY38930.1 crossover junction endodeoxyribonuclease RuvC [Candidatus Krumholzibacteria bacterium]